MTRPRHHRIYRTLLLGSLFAAPVASAHAANFTWTGKAGNDNWNESTNWDPFALIIGPISTDDVFFGEGFLPGGADPFPTGDVDLNGADRVVSSLSIDHNATQTIVDAGNFLGLNSGTLTRDGSGDHQIDAGIRLFKDGTWTVNGTGRLDINAAIVPNAAGAFGLLKDGNGTLRFEGAAANTLTGKYSVKDGTLTLAKSSGVNAVSSDVVLNGGTLLHAQNHNIPDAATVELLGGAYDLAGFTETFDTLKGNSGSIDLGGGDLTVTTLDTSLNVQNPGTLTVSDGDHAGNLTNAAAATLTKNSAGSLKLSGNNTINTLNVNAGTLDLGTGSLTTTNINAPGNINIATGTLTAGVGTLSGTLSGAGQLILNGPGELNSNNTFISGTSPNTNTGLTTITNSAYARFSKTSGVNAIGGDLLITGDSDLLMFELVPVNRGNEQIPDTAKVTIDSGRWELSAVSETIDTLEFTGVGNGDVVGRLGDAEILTILTAITHTGAGMNPGRILLTEINLANLPRTFHTEAGGELQFLSGQIFNGDVTKTGPGTVVFGSGQFNVYTGYTAVQAGTLVLAASQAFDGDLLITGGTVRYEQSHQIPDTKEIDIAAGGTFDLNDYTETIGGLAGNGTVDLGSGHLTTNPFSGRTFSGVITGVGGRLTKEGSATLTLNGNAPNTYTGVTDVQSHTLELGKTPGVDAIGGNLTINGGTARLLNDNQIPDAATVTVNTGGTFNLHAASTETIDTLNLNGGTVLLDGGDLITTNLSGSGTIGTSSGTLTAKQGIYTGTIQGAGVALEKTGNDTLGLAGNSTYAAGTTLNGGTLALGHSNAAGTGPITTANGYREAVLSDGPLLYWNFDEATGNAQEQVRGFAINALAPQGSAGRVDSTIGLGRAAEFTGAGGMRFYSDSLSTGASSYNHYAIELYVQLDNATISSYLLEAGTLEDPFSNDDINHPALIHGFGAPDKLEAFFGGGGRTGAGGPTTLTDNQWHHLVVEVDTTANEHTIYVDGTPVGPFPGATTWNLPRLAVGTILAVSGANPTDGRIDELAFYDLATNPITAQAIANHATASTPVIDYDAFVSIANPIQLQTNIGLNVDTGSATQSGVISEITGSRTVTKSGAGNLNLNGNNTFTGGVFVSGGSLTLGHNNAAGTGNVTVLGSTIAYANGVEIANPIDLGHDADLHVASGSATQSGVISETAGPWSITKTGAGNITLSANNTYTGGTFISGGSLTLANNNAAGSGTITVLGSTIAYANGVNLPNPIDLQHDTDLHVAAGSATQAGIITQTAGPWDVTKTGPGSLTLTGGNAVTPSAFGSLALQEGTVVLDGAHVNLTKSISLSSNGGNLNLQDGAVLGMANQGTVDDASLNLIDPGTSLTGNVLGIAVNPGTFGELTVASSASVDVGMLRFGSDGEGHLTVTSGGRVTADRIYISEIAGSIGTAQVLNNLSVVDVADTLNVGTSGTGILTAGSSAAVEANRVHIGLFEGSSGTATIQESASLDVNTSLQVGLKGNGSLTVQSNATGSTFWLDLGGQSPLFFGGTGSVNVRTGGALQTTANTTFFTNTSSLTADGGTFSTGTLTEHTGVLADIRITDPDPATPAFTIGTNNGNSTINGTIADALGGPGSLSKVGTGTLTLNAANTYSGQTDIHTGTLLANNTTGSATGTRTVTVHAGATLGGTGSVAGPVVVHDGGTLAPGVSPGVFDVDNTLTLEPGTTLQIEVLAPAGGTPVPGTDHDQVNVTAGVTLDGTFQVVPLPDSGPVEDTPLGTVIEVLTYGTRTIDTMFDSITGTLLNTTFALAPLFTDTDTDMADDTLILRASIPGDLNLDNKVSVADLSTFALNFNTTPGLYDEAADTNSWELGDFNTDGQITVADLSLLALNFGFDASDPSTAPIGLSLADTATLAGIDLSSLPEPGTAAALLVMLLSARTNSHGRRE